MSSKLSVVIITFNEERNIAKCIESVQPIADEILVIDSLSTDNTKAIAESLGAKVIEHAFEGHIQQKNWAKNQAQFEFVLSLDADEMLTSELVEEIRNQKEMDFPFAAYTMPRLNFVGDRSVKTCGWYPDRKLRLWRAKDGNWTGINPHDKLKMNMGFDQKRLNGDLLHYSYSNATEILSKSRKYGKIGAENNKNMSWFNLIFKLFFSAGTKFVRNYLFKNGYREGKLGIIICWGQLIETNSKYLGAIKLKIQNR
jgi:glycosyltransferase involved in cell wall biosynthesis